VAFSVNGSNAAKNTTATFTKSGVYNFLVTITNSSSLSVTSSTSVTVKQTATTITVTPSSVTLAAGGTQSFTASESDQFGSAMALQPTLTWTAALGAITSGGAYTAPASSGADSVKATDSSAGIFGSAAVTVTAAASPSFTVFGTGGSGTLAAGTADPNYILVGSIAGTTQVGVQTGNIVVTASNGGFPMPSVWVGDVPNLGFWISPQTTYIKSPGTQDAAGKFIYEQKFNLSGFQPSTASIVGSYAADSYLLGIYLNGVLVNKGGESYAALTAFTINSNFVSGVNTLDFVANNNASSGTSPNPTGLFVEIKSATATAL
jgi:hypothetical protein